MPHGSFEDSVADGAFVQIGWMAEHQYDDGGDVWPLEEWLSREETLLDGDTWHAARARSVGAHAGGVLRRLWAATSERV
jgi:hypothetical protein